MYDLTIKVPNKSFIVFREFLHYLVEFFDPGKDPIRCIYGNKYVTGNSKALYRLLVPLRAAMIKKTPTNTDKCSFTTINLSINGKYDFDCLIDYFSSALIDDQGIWFCREKNYNAFTLLYGYESVCMAAIDFAGGYASSRALRNVWASYEEFISRRRQSQKV